MGKKESSMDLVTRHIIDKSLDAIVDEKSQNLKTRIRETYFLAGVTILGTAVLYLSNNTDLFEGLEETMKRTLKWAPYLLSTGGAIVTAASGISTRKISSKQYEHDVNSILNAYQLLPPEQSKAHNDIIKHLDDLKFTDYELINASKKVLFDQKTAEWNQDYNTYRNNNLLNTKNKKEARELLKEFQLIA